MCCVGKIEERQAIDERTNVVQAKNRRNGQRTALSRTERNCVSEQEIYRRRMAIQRQKLSRPARDAAT